MIRPPSLLPPHRGDSRSPLQFNFAHSLDPPQNIYYGDFGYNRNPQSGYQAPEPQPNPLYNTDPITSQQYRPQGSADYSLVAPYLPIPHYTPGTNTIKLFCYYRWRNNVLMDPMTLYLNNFVTKSKLPIESF